MTHRPPDAVDPGGEDTSDRTSARTSDRTTIDVPPHPSPRTVTVAEALDFAGRQLRRLVVDSPGTFPTYTQAGRWVFGDDPWAPNWSSGFLTGQLWLLHQHTGDPWWREQAERYCRLLKGAKDNTGTHDVGFILEPSWGRWYDLDPTDEARDVLIQGGLTMAGRLQPAGGYLSTWVDPGSTFIDVMMNIGIIFRAAVLSGKDELRDIALQHARTSRRYLMRGDGSTIHEGWFDTTSGQFLGAATHQGWRPDSTWARGQAWAIYGFTDAYRHTGEQDMLDAAVRAADYFAAHTPDGVPPNDWLEPDPALKVEASAAAIAASAFLRLALVEGGLSGRDDYRDFGLTILERLRGNDFIAVDTPGWQGILQHSTYHYGNGIGIDESVMWGDHYFVEALSTAARHFSTETSS